MADTYDSKEIEQKWQARWETSTCYQAGSSSSKPKYYALIEFPYPSSEGLHVGHPRSYVGMDIVARKRRMEGYNVLFPIGWDAFGLPAENYAIKTGIHPRVITRQNIANFRRQLKMLGLSVSSDAALPTRQKSL
jgi:leucyl-tRNA synthetase